MIVIIQYLTFWDCLLSLGMLSLRFTYVVESVGSLFLFVAEYYYYTMWMCHSFFIHFKLHFACDVTSVYIVEILSNCLIDLILSFTNGCIKFITWVCHNHFKHYLLIGIQSYQLLLPHNEYSCSSALICQ